MPTLFVRYRTKPDRAEENQQLIERVFEELAERDPGGEQRRVPQPAAHTTARSSGTHGGGGGDAAGGTGDRFRCFLPLPFLASDEDMPSRPRVPPTSALTAPRRDRRSVTEQVRVSKSCACMA